MRYETPTSRRTWIRPTRLRLVYPATLLALAPLVHLLDVAEDEVGVTGFFFGTLGAFLLLIPVSFALVSPASAIVCFQKGRRAGGWMGVLALPVMILVFVVGIISLRSQELDGFSGVGAGMGVVFLAVVAGVGAGFVSLTAATKAARPGSKWAARWYPLADSPAT